MNLTEEQAKKETIKAFEDLNLYCSTKYPVQVNFIDKTSEFNDLDIGYWAGSYNYSDPEAVGDEINYGEYPEYIIIIDDQKGEAVIFSYYTGHYYLELKNGKYEELGRVRKMKRPW